MDNYFLILISVCAIILNDLCKGQDGNPMPPLITSTLKDIQYFASDEETILDCAAEGTEPISYEWEKILFNDDGEREVIDKYSEDPDPTVTLDGSVLTISTTAAQHEGLYQCTASNEHGTTLSRIVKLLRTYIKKPSKSSEVIQVEGLEGAPLSIECDKSKGFPKPSFSWVLKSEADKSTEPIGDPGRITVDDKGTLHFANVVPEDQQAGKFYVCNQRNPITDIKYGGSQNNLTVIPADTASSVPHLVDSLHLENDLMVIGKHARIQCIFSGNPTPEVTWTYTTSEGEQELPSVLHFINDGKSALVHTLGKQLEEDEPAPPGQGELKCIAENSEGMAEDTIPINIEYAPRLATAPIGRGVPENETVFFVCGAEANPPPEVKFIINGEDVDPENPGPRRSIQSKQMNWDPYTAENTLQLILIISGTCLGEDCEGGADIFSIQCNASNKHGSALGSGYLSVYEAPGNDTDAADTGAGGDDTDDPNACTDPEVLLSIDACKDTYQEAAIEDGLCISYCHYNICITDLKLDCNSPPVGDMSFCDGLCIQEGLFEDPDKKDSEEEHKGLSKRTILIICIIILVLIFLLILFVICKICQKRRQKRTQKKKYRDVPTFIGVKAS